MSSSFSGFASSSSGGGSYSGYASSSEGYYSYDGDDGGSYSTSDLSTGVAENQSELDKRMKRIQGQYVAFKKHVKKMVKHEGFIKEYTELGEMEQRDRQPLIRLTKSIVTKNRYLDIIPVARTNVMLKSGKRTYINANYMDMWGLRYVATQGPLKETVDDFWHMVWQERASVVVMVTNLQELGVDKCSRYWPDSRSELETSQLVIYYKQKEDKGDCMVRQFVLRDRAEDTQRVVYQIHFTAWPDQGVPTVHDLAHTMSEADKHNRKSKGPMVVHCSAGVGRTGVFIAAHAIIHRLVAYANGLSVKYNTSRKHPLLFDVMGTVRAMRRQRPFMVQTPEQYIFLHTFLLEQIKSFLR